MSYLSELRIHFSGSFQANVSTVNNDPGHWENDTFLPEYQEMQTKGHPNGWFNPEGDGSWRLLGCRVTSAWNYGIEVDRADPLLTCTVEDSDRRVPAKLVDLDSEQQMVSEIWGLEVRLVAGDGANLLRGNFVPAAFTDLYPRGTGEGDRNLSAMYQSQLVDLEWGDTSSSPFLESLRGAADDGLLSVKFNLDAIDMDFESSTFMCGRIAGTIGPASADEPVHFVRGRQLVVQPSGDPTVAPINYCVATLDEQRSVLLVDLGNALPSEGRATPSIGDLVFAAGRRPLAMLEAAGPSGYTADGWYESTAGVVELPVDPAQVRAAAALPLTVSRANGTAPEVLIAEAADGRFVRADTFVFRMSPGDIAQIRVHATEWGNPLAGAVLTVVGDDSQFQPSNSINPNDVPQVQTPTDALDYPSTIRTGDDGVVILPVRANDPGTPRYFRNGTSFGLDGQIFGLRPGFAESPEADAVNPSNFVSIHVWSAFLPRGPITWDDIAPILQQYANLYPVMGRFLDMGNMDDVLANKMLLELAFKLDPSDPNSMPVTRDLSPAKRDAIISWLDDPLPGSGAAAPTARAAVIADSPRSDREAVVSPALAALGGKTAAMARRLGTPRTAANDEVAKP